MSVSQYCMGWCTSGQAGFLEIWRILPGIEGAGGILFFIREAKIAEMKVSEPFKNTFLRVTEDPKGEYGS